MRRLLADPETFLTAPLLFPYPVKLAARICPDTDVYRGNSIGRAWVGRDRGPEGRVQDAVRLFHDIIVFSVPFDLDLAQ